MFVCSFFCFRIFRVICFVFLYWRCTDCCNFTKLHGWGNDELLCRTSWTKANFFPLVTGSALAPNQRDEIVSCVPNKIKKKKHNKTEDMAFMLAKMLHCGQVGIFTATEWRWQLPCMKRFTEALQHGRSVRGRFGGFGVVSCHWTDPLYLTWSHFFLFHTMTADWLYIVLRTLPEINSSQQIRSACGRQSVWFFTFV